VAAVTVGVTDEGVTRTIGSVTRSLGWPEIEGKAP
jgi:hypothetical protein